MCLAVLLQIVFPGWQDPERYHLHSPSLLDISGCNITDQDVPAVVSLLLRISVTASINLCNNNISDNGADLLMTVLDANECIEAIATAGNDCQAAILIREDDHRLNIWSCLYPSHTVSFEYESDFDDRGVVYFLGTHGRTRPYQNPCKSGQVSIMISLFQISWWIFLDRHVSFCHLQCARKLHAQPSLWCLPTNFGI